MLFLRVVFLIVQEAEEIIIWLSVRLPHEIAELASGTAGRHFKISDTYDSHLLPFSQILIATSTMPVIASRVAMACQAIKSRIALFLFIWFW